MVHVGNDRHVTDVTLLVHNLADLIDREVHHFDGFVGLRFINNKYKTNLIKFFNLFLKQK